MLHSRLVSLALVVGAAAQSGTAPCFEDDLCDRDAAKHAETEAACAAAGAECTWNAGRSECRGSSQCPGLLSICIADPSCVAAAQVTADDPFTPQNDQAAAWAGSPGFSAYLGCLGRCQNPACGDEMEALYQDEAALTALMTEDDPATEDVNEKAHAWTTNEIQMAQAVRPIMYQCALSVLSPSFRFGCLG